MSTFKNRKEATERLALGAIFTALVILLQLLGAFIRFGTFSVSLVLAPIIIGAALCGWKLGGWFGFAFGLAVLLSGDAAAFLSINPLGTVVTVLLKGTLCGLAAGLCYKFLENRSVYLAALVSAIAAPVVNTGVFLIGCRLFFFEAIAEWGVSAGAESTVEYMFLFLAGGNFIFELITNIVLVPVIIKILKLVKK
ncbi:MAG: ECF transporter S component [Ruminococcaceae bacterium]|nr:ECF transporter S component [Oscillospiraceae bacterium]